MKKSSNFMNAQNYTINQKIVGIINKQYNKIQKPIQAIYIIFIPPTFLIFSLFLKIDFYIGIYVLIGTTIIGFLMYKFSTKDSNYNYDIYTKNPMTYHFYINSIRNSNHIFNDEIEKYFYIHK